MDREKPTPSWLMALGRHQPPARVELADGAYERGQILKHDFFACTTIYHGDDGRKAIVKIGRRASLIGLPMGWIGRLLTTRECCAYDRLGDLPAIPRFLGRVGAHGFAHAYIEGHPLRRGERVADDFFPKLRDALQTMHRRDSAYVDLEKCENVLVGDDGEPYLIDFQLAWILPRRYGGDLWPMTWIRRRLQQADLYHVVKLQRRTRPDQLTPEQITASYRKPWYVRWFGFVTRPVTLIRRRVLARIDPRPRGRERGRLDARF